MIKEIQMNIWKIVHKIKNCDINICKVCLRALYEGKQRRKIVNNAGG